MFRKLLIALFATLILITACGQAPVTAVPTQALAPSPIPTQAPTSAPTPTSILLTDGLKRTVTLASPAQRIVSLAPSNTEILFAVGAGAQVVGRDTFSDYPDAAKSVQDIGGSMGQYNTEAIVALHPDLVLAGGINTPELVASLEKLGLTVYFLPNPATLEEMYTNLETVAALTGHAAEAGTLVASLKSRVAAVDAKIATAAAHPSVFYEVDATDATKPYTYGPGTFGDLLIQRAGGRNVGAQLKDPYPQISLELLLVANPDVILLGDALYGGVTPEKVAARPGWTALAAVKNKQVFPFDDNLISRPGPRMVDGLEALAKLLHPDLFK